MLCSLYTAKRRRPYRRPGGQLPRQKRRNVDGEFSKQDRAAVSLAMSSDRERVQQVWLPSSGVWAAIPAQKGHRGAADEAEMPAAVAGSRQRASREKPPAKEPVAGHKRRQGSTDAAPDAAAGAAPAASKPQKQRQQAAPSAAAVSAAAGGAASPPAYTGFKLQHGDEGEGSDVEDCEPPPTCPICERRQPPLPPNSVCATPGPCFLILPRAPGERLPLAHVCFPACLLARLQA